MAAVSPGNILNVKNPEDFSFSQHASLEDIKISCASFLKMEHCYKLDIRTGTGDSVIDRLCSHRIKVRTDEYINHNYPSGSYVL